MLTSLIYFAPGLAGLTWAILFLVRKKDRHQTVFFALLWLVSFYFLFNAVIFMPNANYDILVRIDVICVPLSLSICAVVVQYLYGLLPGSGTGTIGYFLYIPAIIAGSMIVLLYYLVGFDNAARLIETFDLVGYRLPEFQTPLYETYVFVDTSLVAIFSAPYFLAGVYLVVIVLMRGSRVSIYKALLMFAIMMLMLPYAAFGRKYMIAHEVMTMVSMLLLAASSFVLSYVEYYYKTSQESRSREKDAELDVALSAAPHASQDRMPLLVEKFVGIMESGAYRKDDLTLEQAAHMMGVGRSVLSALINNHFGLSFRDVVGNYRIDAAKKYMIEHPDARQSEVAFECGFKDNTSFNRKFKEKEGCTPLKWKSVNLDENAKK